MAGRECYHCKQSIEAGEAHNCWTTTEDALTRDLSPELTEAWERLRETAAEFGEQRIYASLNSIMFSRTTCYCFVRPKTRFLEVCVFLGRTVTAPQLRRVVPASKTKIAHLFHVRHRDEVESPVTDWMREAYEQSEALSARGTVAGRATPARVTAKDVPRAKATKGTVRSKANGTGNKAADKTAHKGVTTGAIPHGQPAKRPTEKRTRT